MSDREWPGVEPIPPRVSGWLPGVQAGFAMLRNPVRFFEKARQRHGDTYIVDAFGYRLFCVFSAPSLRALYELPEEQASFGLATYELVFKHKVPLEMLLGRRNRPHDLFGKSEVESYLDNLEDAMRREIAELGDRGSFEIFAEARRLGYRLGLASWAGAEAAASPRLDALIEAFDVLDSADSFVRPTQAFAAYATGKRRELRAMKKIEEVFADILAARQRRGQRVGDFLDQVWDSFADLPMPERAINVARDLMVLQMGAQSNLFAALGWTLVNLLLHPEHLARVTAGDDVLLEQCANESIRLAQSSITLRRVMQPIEIRDQRRSYRLDPGVFLTTMLPLNNRCAAPGLDRFDPSHYEGRKLAAHVELPCREMVSTFGHGRHSCPAQRFSITAIRIAIRRLLERYDLQPQFRSASPPPRQIGGVARAAAPCIVVFGNREPGAGNAIR